MPFYKQQDQMDCGPTCLRMIIKFYGRSVSIHKLRKLCYADSNGVTLLAISDAAEKLGFRTIGAKLTLTQLRETKLPCIIHWQQSHFVVLYKVVKGKYYIADPGEGLIVLTEYEFKSGWFIHKNDNAGISLLLSVGAQFYEQVDEKHESISWLSILSYYYSHRRLFIQLFLGLALGTLLSLVTPFLTQAIVDVGINTKNLHFVYLILIAQITLFVGSTSVNFVRSWILLHISTRINLSVLTDFLIKLMKVPINFFQKKTTGDILQRMSDQQKIESFLTGTTFNTIFSIINLVVFTTVLIHFNLQVFFISLFSTVLYCIWIMAFLKKRRGLNYKQFTNASANQSSIVELVNGMQDIKLNNCEKQKRWAWEEVQAHVFKYKIKMLALTQYQQAGSSLINQIKNILITFLSVKAVIDGSSTLGGMMAIQYIAGQLSTPIEQILNFVQTYQDAKISLERLNEVYLIPDEEPAEKKLINIVPVNKSIRIKNLTFRYGDFNDKPVLNNINLEIPQGKTTAIVGMSGSGKTSILKLLLRFHEFEKGEVKIGDVNLNDISFKSWRKSCGAVLQDSFIFSDTIINNITIGDDFPDDQKLKQAITIANLSDYIDTLPFGLNTRIGASGNGLSQGQKQRLLIARAVYKQPDFLFFDEATNSLDANNERIIMQNLNSFFNGRTVVIIAHRLSTITNSDKIVMMHEGKIIEEGSHQELCTLKGDYYKLVKNQLEIAI